MYCTKCGKQNPDGKNYCTFCGAPLRKAEPTKYSGKRAKQKEQSRQNPKQKLAEPIKEQNKNKEAKAVKPGNPKKKRRSILIVAICAAVLIAGGLTTMRFLGGNGSNGAEQYYQDNGEVVSTVDADKSADVQTEAEAIDEMQQRGFDQYPVSYESAMGGEYGEDREASVSSKEKHPTYKTYYRTEEDKLWTISVINGSVTAYPVDATVQTAETETLVSETESIYCYDIETNTYFDVIPDKSRVKLIIVDKINADTLGKLTKEGLNEQ